MAKDADGKIIGINETSEVAIPSGYEMCLQNHFWDLENVESFSPTVKAVKSKYKAAIQDLSYEKSETTQKVIVSCKNVGNNPVEFAEGIALFFKNGQLIAYDSTYFTDDDSEIKSGDTVMKELNAYQEYDDVKIWFSGRR